MSNHFFMTTLDTNYQKLVFDEQPLFYDDYRYDIDTISQSLTRQLLGHCITTSQMALFTLLNKLCT